MMSSQAEVETTAPTDAKNLFASAAAGSGYQVLYYTPSSRSMTLVRKHERNDELDTASLQSLSSTNEFTSLTPETGAAAPHSSKILFAHSYSPKSEHRDSPQAVAEALVYSLATTPIVSRTTSPRFQTAVVDRCTDSERDTLRQVLKDTSVAEEIQQQRGTSGLMRSVAAPPIDWLSPETLKKKQKNVSMNLSYQSEDSVFCTGADTIIYNRSTEEGSLDMSSTSRSLEEGAEETASSAESALDHADIATRPRGDSSVVAQSPEISFWKNPPQNWAELWAAMHQKRRRLRCKICACIFGALLALMCIVTFMAHAEYFV